MSHQHDDRPSDTTPADPAIRMEFGGRHFDEAIDLYSRDYNGSGFHAERTQQPFSYRYSITGDDEVTLRSSMFMASMRGTVQLQGEYVVSWITAGNGVMDIGADEVRMVPGRPAMFPTEKRYAFHFSDVRQNLIHFDSTYLERVAAETVGAEVSRLHFHHSADVDDVAIRRWHDTIARVASTVLGGTSGPLLRSEVNRLAAEALLETFPHDGPRVPSLALLPGNARLATAVEFMHAHAAEPITTTDVAGAAGLSLRGLQHAFNHQLDTTPTEYLRGLRLESVRTELLAASPHGTTIATIAGRWGFAHSGRFSAAYLTRFGEYPAETLRR